VIGFEAGEIAKERAAYYLLMELRERQTSNGSVAGQLGWKTWVDAK
jgi:hypothetical protein